jgi:antirestriction protein ArdC
MNNKAYKAIADRIATKMESEGLFWRKPWKANEKRPVNGVSGRAYTGLNSFFLRGRFNDHRWYTAGHMKKNQIKWEGKGEMIYGWFCTMRSYSPKRHDEKGKEIQWASMALKYWYVWNHEQTNLPQADHSEHEVIDFVPIEKAHNVLTAYIEREEIDFRHEGASAYYSPVADRVVLPPENTFKSAEHYYGVAFHEIGHSTGHKTRLKRDIANVFGDHKYSFEELVAEMTSCYVSHECGIDNQEILDNSAAYIQNWSKKLKEAPEGFIKACRRAEKATDFILKEKV